MTRRPTRRAGLLTAGVVLVALAAALVLGSGGSAEPIVVRCPAAASASTSAPASGRATASAPVPAAGRASASPPPPASGRATASPPAPAGRATAFPPNPASGRASASGPAPNARRPPTPAVEIRVNQVGYVSGCPKLALVMSQRPLADPSFVLLRGARAILRGRVGPSRSAWSPTWPYVYPLDLSTARGSGRYLLSVGGARSPTFTIGPAPALYSRVVADAVGFLTAQRDGAAVLPGPLHRAASHLLDGQARVYAQPSYRGLTLSAPLRATGLRVDASGGWFDAGDYLKFVETASFVDVLGLITLRDYNGPPALRSEVRLGLDWLAKMWDARRRVLYYQVGIGDGNGGSVLGDHDLWRLPQADDERRPRPGAPAYYVSYRPVFAANRPGGPISPNLAGRVAAAFGLCAQVFARDDPARAQRCMRDGQSIYALADPHPGGELLTTSPHAYYNETEWRDDMELGATELFLGGRAIGRGYPPRPATDLYLNDAGQWANAYISSRTNGMDSLNLYDVSALAHYDLVRVLTSAVGVKLVSKDRRIDVPTDPPSLLKDYSDQLALAARLGGANPFGLSNPATNLDTVPHALGYAIQARLYDLLIHRPAYEGLAATQIDWALGENAWGSSFVVGAGSTFPRCLAHQVANLSGSLTGMGPLLRGATIDGPNDPASLRGRGAPDGYRPCPGSGPDPWAAFDGPGLAYLDDVTSFTTSEPSDDFAALGLLAFAQQSTAR